MLHVKVTIPIGSMYGIYANIWGIWMVNVTIYSIHGSYGIPGKKLAKTLGLFNDDLPISFPNPSSHQVARLNRRHWDTRCIGLMLQL